MTKRWIPRWWLMFSGALLSTAPVAADEIHGELRTTYPQPEPVPVPITGQAITNLIQGLFVGSPRYQPASEPRVAAARRDARGASAAARAYQSAANQVKPVTEVTAPARAAAEDKAKAIAETLRTNRRRLAHAAGPPELKKITDAMIDTAETVARERGLALPTVTSRFRGGVAHGKKGAVDLVFETSTNPASDSRSFQNLADALAAAIADRLDCSHEVLVERVAPAPPLSPLHRNACFYRKGTDTWCRVECRDGTAPGPEGECPPLSDANRGSFTTALHIHVERDGNCPRTSPGEDRLR